MRCLAYLDVTVPIMRSKNGVPALLAIFTMLPALASELEAPASIKDKTVAKAISEWRAFAINTPYPNGIILDTPDIADKVDSMHLELAKCSQVNKFWNSLPSRSGVVSSNQKAMAQYYSVLKLDIPAKLPPGTSNDGRQFFDTCLWPSQRLPGNATIPGTNNKRNFWDLYPWSAAFISYLFNSSDPLKRFPAAGGHWEYINQAIRAEAKPTAPFQAVDATSNAPRVGDLLCASRNAEPMTYQDIKSRAKEGRGYESHCDLVVAKRPGMIEVIGGNVSDSIAKTIVPVDGNGVVMSSAPSGWSTKKWDKWKAWRPWAVIIRNNLQ